MNQTPNPIKEYYIAYFDIMGYKEFFKRQPSRVPALLGSIHDAVRRTKEYVSRLNESLIVGEMGNVDVCVRVFSDNILLCLEAMEAGFEQARILSFLQIVADIQRGFVNEYGLFVRGGVLKGELSCNADYVFGRGLIDVVEMEEKIAIYPRILISPDLVAILQGNHFYTSADLERIKELGEHLNAQMDITSEEQVFFNQVFMKVKAQKLYEQVKASLIMQWPDGNWTLSYLCHHDKEAHLSSLGDGFKEHLLHTIQAVSPRDYQLASQPPTDIDEMLLIHKTRVEERLKQYGSNSDIDSSDVAGASLRERILRKYIWVMCYHNIICDLHQKNEHVIHATCNCDPRFMKMTIEVLDNVQANEACVSACPFKYGGNPSAPAGMSPDDEEEG